MTSMIARFKSLLTTPARLFCNGDGAAPPEAAEALACSTLLNFQASQDEGWFPVATVGEHPHKRGLQVCTGSDAQTLVNWAAGQPETWTGVALYANPPHPAGGDDPPALAWAREFRIVGNEVQCRPEFSETGRELVLANKAYKRVTVAWKCRRGSDGWHPFEIDHIGLTNKPNMESVRPWVNGPEAEAAAPEESAAADAESAAAQEMESLRAELQAGQSAMARLANSAGVEAEADPDTLCGAVDALCNRAARLERDLADAKSALETERTIANEALADKFIALRKVDPKKRVQAVQLLHNDRDNALAVWSADSAPAGTPPPADPLAGRVLRNAGLGTVERASEADLARIVAQALELQNTDGLSPDQANERAWQMFANGKLRGTDNENEKGV